jgi:hypothetical protein
VVVPYDSVFADVRGNTTNLSQHLSKVHPDELKQNSPATLQPTLQQTFNRNEDTSKSLTLPSKRSEEITRYIAEYIIHDMCPISTVDGIGFRRLINSMEPRYTIPSRKHFTETVFLKMYQVPGKYFRKNGVRPFF